jgi:hypothetical protein
MMPSIDVRDEVNNFGDGNRDKMKLPLASAAVTIALRKLPQAGKPLNSTIWHDSACGNAKVGISRGD